MSRKRLFSAAFGLCLLAGGCTVIDNGARTLVLEPWQFCMQKDECRALKKYNRLADEAWAQVCADNGGGFSPDYATGFRDGYVSYLDAGGTGAPPPIPPRYYWKSTYQSPGGHQAIYDWYTGCELGARVAQQSGYRELITVPSSINRMPFYGGSPATQFETIAPAIPDLSPESLLPPPQGAASEAVAPALADDLGSEAAIPASYEESQESLLPASFDVPEEEHYDIERLPAPAIISPSPATWAAEESP
jgi:hypothetical protein